MLLPRNCLISTAKHFDVGHLLIQELNYALKGIRYLISDEQETHTLSGEVCSHFLPKAVSIRFAICL